MRKKLQSGGSYPTLGWYLDSPGYDYALRMLVPPSARQQARRQSAEQAYERWLANEELRNYRATPYYVPSTPTRRTAQTNIVSTPDGYEIPEVEVVAPRPTPTRRTAQRRSLTTSQGGGTDNNV